MEVDAAGGVRVRYGVCPKRPAREAWMTPRHGLNEEEWYALMFEQYVRPVRRPRSPRRHALKLYEAGLHLQHSARFLCSGRQYYRPVKLPGCAVRVSCPPWFQCDWCNCALWPCRCEQQSSDVTNPRPIPRGPSRKQAKGGISFFAKLFRMAADGCFCDMKAPGPNFCPADRLDFMCGRGRGLDFETRRRVRMLAEAEQRQDGVFQEEIEVHKVPPRPTYMADKKKEFRSIGVQTYTELDDLTLYMGEAERQLIPRRHPLRTAARSKRAARRRGSRQSGAGDARSRAPPPPATHLPSADTSVSKLPELADLGPLGSTNDDQSPKGVSIGPTDAVGGLSGSFGPTSPRFTPRGGPVGPTSPRFTPRGGPVGPTSPRFTPEGKPTSPRFMTKDGFEGSINSRFTPGGDSVGPISPRFTPEGGPVRPTSSRIIPEDDPVGPSSLQFTSERGPQDPTSTQSAPAGGAASGTGRRLTSRKSIAGWRNSRLHSTTDAARPKEPLKTVSRKMVPYITDVEPSASEEDNTVCDLTGKRLWLEREDSVHSSSSKKSCIVNKILRILKWD